MDQLTDAQPVAGPTFTVRECACRAVQAELCWVNGRKKRKKKHFLWGWGGEAPTQSEAPHYSTPTLWVAGGQDLQVIHPQTYTGHCRTWSLNVRMSTKWQSKESPAISKKDLGRSLEALKNVTDPHHQPRPRESCSPRSG